jgi:hypothetical protein
LNNVSNTISNILKLAQLASTIKANRSDTQFHPLAVPRREAAELLGIHPNSLDRLVKRGLLRPSRALRRPLYAIQELQRFLAETT